MYYDVVIQFSSGSGVSIKMADKPLALASVAAWASAIANKATQMDRPLTLLGSESMLVLIPSAVHAMWMTVHKEIPDPTELMELQKKILRKQAEEGDDWRDS